MKKYIYEIDSNGFIAEVRLGIFDNKGYLIEPLGDFITTDLPQPLFFHKPKWSGSEWIEGATQEEIDEITKVEPQQPTEMELLKEELANTNSMLLEMMELLLGGI